MLKLGEEDVGKVEGMIKSADLEKLRSVHDVLNTELTTLQRNLDNLNVSMKGADAFDKKVVAKDLTRKIDIYKKILGLSSKELSTYGVEGGSGLISDSAKDGLSSITSGGSRPTNITINLGKFQDQIVIHAANVKEGAQEMRAIIVEEFARVLNSANFSASQ